MATLLAVSLIAGMFCGMSEQSSAKTVYGSDKLVHNSRFDGCTAEYGIDVSKWQGDIDWKEVKKAGISFAFIRVAARGTAAAGGRITDPKAVVNMKGCEENGIPYGVYVFSQALTQKEAKEEADWVLEMIEGYHPTLPIVFDYEYSDGGRLTTGLSLTKKTNNCLAFCKKIRDAGYQPMLYANKSFLTNSINADAISQTYPIWLAHYSNETDYTGDYDYWQYSSSGEVNGISGHVDMNVRYVPTRVMNVQTQAVFDSQICLTWDSYPDAVSYEVWRKKEDETQYTKIATLQGQESVTYTDDGLSANEANRYKVRAKCLIEEKQQDASENAESEKNKVEQYSAFSSPVRGYTTVKKTVTMTAKNVSFDSISLKWTTWDRADGYEVLKYDSAKKTYRSFLVLSGANANTCKDKELVAGTTYRYQIRTYRTTKTGRLNGPLTGITVKTSGKVKGYVNLAKAKLRNKPDASGKVLKEVSKNVVLTVSSSSGSWYRTEATVNGKKKTVYIKKKQLTLVSPAIPDLKQKSATFSSNTLQWNQVSAVSGYEVQKYNASKKKYETLKVIADKKTVTCKDQDLRSDTTYRYRVRAYKTVGTKKICGAWSKVLSAKTGSAKQGVITKKTQLRKTAAEKGKILVTIKKGTKVSVCGASKGWYRVTYKSGGKKQTGYISKKYLKL